MPSAVRYAPPASHKTPLASIAEAVMTPKSTESVRSRTERRKEQRADKRSRSTGSKSPGKRQPPTPTDSEVVPAKRRPQLPSLPLTAEERRLLEESQREAERLPILSEVDGSAQPVDSQATIRYDDDEYDDTQHDAEQSHDESLFARTAPEASKPWSYYVDMPSVIEEQCAYLLLHVQSTAKQPIGNAEAGPEFEIGYADAKYYIGLPAFASDEVLVFKAASKQGKQKVVLIEKALDALSAADIRDHWPLVLVAIRLELASFLKHGVFERRLRAVATNVCSSRWVLRWKIIDKVRSVKARLTVRGYEDTGNVTTFASTATRWSQRLIVSIAVQEGWDLFVSDVATAFLQSDTFSEVAEQTSTQIRDVSFMPPKDCNDEIKRLAGFETWDPVHEVLHLLRPVYGLKDAPKMWKRKLNDTLLKLGGIPAPTDNSVYCFYKGSRLTAAIATHVDDIKGCGEVSVIKALLEGLTQAFGTLKTSFREFEHCGLIHRQTQLGVEISQDHYAKQLRVVPLVGLDTANVDTLLTPAQIKMFQSILGGLSWLIQTRADLCIYVCHLQRVAHRATTGHILTVNQLVRWVRKQRCFLFYKRLVPPIRCIVISDAAFRKETAAGLSMRGAVIGIAEAREDQHGKMTKFDGPVHIIEYFARKQRRVVRSTFSAELNACCDAYEIGRLVTLTYCSCYLPGRSAAQLQVLEHNGKLPMHIVLIIDCMSILETLKQEVVKTPSEATLILLLLGLKEALLSHHLKAIAWVDTRDMLADALNKGAISRRALVEASCLGEWVLKHPFVQHGEVVHRAVKAVFDD